MNLYTWVNPDKIFIVLVHCMFLDIRANFIWYGSYLSFLPSTDSSILETWYCTSFHWLLCSLHYTQVPLFNILKKYDGETVTEIVRPKMARMRYRVVKLPPYLILHMHRFTKNNFFVEKNPTLGKNKWFLKLAFEDLTCGRLFFLCWRFNYVVWVAHREGVGFAQRWS